MGGTLNKVVLVLVLAAWISWSVRDSDEYYQISSLEVWTRSEK